MASAPVKPLLFDHWLISFPLARGIVNHLNAASAANSNLNTYDLSDATLTAVTGNRKTGVALRSDRKRAKILSLENEEEAEQKLVYNQPLYFISLYLAKFCNTDHLRRSGTPNTAYIPNNDHPSMASTRGLGYNQSLYLYPPRRWTKSWPFNVRSLGR